MKNLAIATLVFCAFICAGKVQIYIYMLFAGWEVRMVKNCDRGLEYAARRAAFSRPSSQFFTIQTDPKPVNNLFIFFLLGKKN